MTDEQRAALAKMARSTSLPHRKVVQAQALLLAADGVATNEIARRCHTTNDSVRAVAAAIRRQGVDGVGRIAPGRGRRSWLPEGTVAAVVHDTLHATPDDGSTHWTTRLMAARFGIGKDSVARIWRDHKLKPWLVDTFKLSNDPAFEAKLVDVVGLYMNPPERAVVFSFDEKTQVQALDRTQPSLPLTPGRAGTMTHDYKRNGTTDLFAALNVATGEVLYDTRKSHTAKTCSPSSSSSTCMCPRTSRSTSSSTTSPPTRRRRWPSGWPIRSGLAGTCTSSPPARRGSTSSSAGSTSSPNDGFAAACSPRRRPHRGHRDLVRALERRPQALRLAQAGRGDHRQGASRTSSTRPSQFRVTRH